MTEPFRIGMLLFPGLTQLDLTGPFELLARIPGAAVELVWKERGPVKADSGLSLVATQTMAACAATHWMYMELLPAYGAIPADERVVVDSPRGARSAAPRRASPAPSPRR